MSKTWIVVSDSSRARIFSEKNGKGKLMEIKELAHPQAQAHETALATDEPETVLDRQGQGRHALNESISPKEHEAQKFCHRLAEEIESGRTHGHYEQLAMIAPPAFLGKLRKAISAPTARLVVFQLDKDLVHMKEEAIFKHLPAKWVE